MFRIRFLINSHVHSPLARAMYTAIRGARVTDKFQDSLYLFLELIRAGVMHGHLWSHRAFSGGPSFGTGEWSPDLFALSCFGYGRLSWAWAAALSRFRFPALPFLPFRFAFLPRRSPLSDY